MMNCVINSLSICYTIHLLSFIISNISRSHTDWFGVRAFFLLVITPHQYQGLPNRPTFNILKEGIFFCCNYENVLYLYPPLNGILAFQILLFIGNRTVTLRLMKLVNVSGIHAIWREARLFGASKKKSICSSIKQRKGKLKNKEKNQY